MFICRITFAFFFQAEDGIRDHCVTGVQTCALPISTLCREDFDATAAEESYTEGVVDHLRSVEGTKVAVLVRELANGDGRRRSEERRVGKEGRSRGRPCE